MPSLLRTFMDLSNRSSTTASNQLTSPSPKNWTITRIWKALNADNQPSTPEKEVINQLRNVAKNRVKKENIDYPVGSVGHASAETGLCYGSFWPQPGTLSDLKSPVPPYSPSLAEDIFLERHEPDVTVTLYSLNQSAITQECRRLKRDAQYALKVKANPQFRDGKKENCSTATYLMLKAGYHQYALA
jgi:hypothetical protein